MQSGRSIGLVAPGVDFAGTGLFLFLGAPVDSLVPYPPPLPYFGPMLH